MTYQEIFEAYYTLYRAESQVPAITDDEYAIGLRFANEAVNRWQNYDATYWKELFTNLQSASDGDKIVIASQTEYAAPTDMREAGGYIRTYNAQGTQRHIPIIEPQEAQFKGDDQVYAYFTGSPSQGYTLRLNPAPTTQIIGNSIDYVYYKKATKFSVGADMTEAADPYFIVNQMLANRFRASRNWSGYQTALRDANELLKIMKMDNDSGTWANPWKLADNSGSVWGGSDRGSWSW